MLVPSPAYLKGISIFGPGVNISFLPGLAVLVVECGVHFRVGVSEDVKRMVLVLKMILLLMMQMLLMLLLMLTLLLMLLMLMLMLLMMMVMLLMVRSYLAHSPLV